MRVLAQLLYLKGPIQLYRLQSRRIQTTSTVVLDVDASLADSAPDEGISYSLSGVDAKAFTLAENGSLSFNASPDFEAAQDADRDNIYDVKITATATGETGEVVSSDKAVQIEVTDILEISPEIKFTSPSFSVVSENTDDIVLDVDAALDEGVLDGNIVYSLSGADADVV